MSATVLEHVWSGEENWVGITEDPGDAEVSGGDTFTDFGGGPLTRLHRACYHVSPRLVDIATDMTREGASKSFVRRFKRESYLIPLGILKGILALGTDPVRAFREMEDALESSRISMDMLKSTRYRLDAPQEKVASLLDELLMVQDLLEAVLREYKAPVEMRSWLIHKGSQQ